LVFTRFFVAACLAGVLPVAGRSALAEETPAAAGSTTQAQSECPDDDIEKDGLCGFARAAIARIELEKTLTPSQRAVLLELQNDTDVTHCFLDIAVTIGPNLVSGSNTLDVTSKTNGLTQFTLNLKSNMTVSTVLVNGVAAVFTRPTDQIVITLDHAYNVGQTFQVKVSYSGLPTGLGMGGSSGDGSGDSFTFKTHGSPATSIVSSLSQPYFAYTWWPCKENLVSNADKFTMDLWVTAPNTLTVASNGTLQGIDTIDATKNRTRWKSNYPNTTYGVSVAMTNYSKTVWTYNYTGGSMPVELYLYPESASTSLASLSNLVEMISTLADPGTYGQFPFVNEKYGIAQFPTNFGVEHQTMTSQGNFVERRNVHEMAHSWWGNSITCKTWNHIWVNEGWARYAESLYYERRPGGSYAAYLSHLNTYRPNTSAEFAGVIYRSDISTSDTIFSSGIVYDKGQWVMHMLRHVLGDALFFQALADYRVMYEGGTAGIDDYQAVVESTSGQDLDWFFNEWIYAGGAPSYRYGWQQEQIGGQNYVRLHIQQYQTSYPLFRMPIDITLQNGFGNETRVVQHEAATEWYLLPTSAPITNLQFDTNTWILREAGTNVAYQPGPPKVIGTTPIAGSRAYVSPGITSVDVQFSEPVTFNSSYFSMIGSRTGSQPFAAAYNPANYTATLSFAQPLPGGQTWSIHVADALKSTAGNLALDGEVSDPNNPASLPSGDGPPGGEAIISFYVAAVGDYDLDVDVDAVDFEVFSGCAAGPLVLIVDPGCMRADLDSDGDGDQTDFGLFQRCLSGSGVPSDPMCAD